MALRRAPAGPDADGGAHQEALALFSVLWALAAIWHVLGNTRTAPGWAQAALALAAGLVMWRPGSVTPLALLAVAGLVTAWEEAPLIGNHWVLAAFVDLAILMAMGTALLRRRWRSRVDLAARLFPVARLCLLGFYGFAAFAKLNSAFFDRATSCALFFFNESTDSLGASALQLDGAAWLQWCVIVGTATAELSIPVLLAVRRTRHLGVVVALVFHGLLAIDRTHQFFDFSSVLAALFLLFLPRSSGTWVAERVGSIRARLALADERLPQVVHGALAIVPVVAALGVATDAIDADAARTVGWWPWQLMAVALVVLTLRYLDQRPPAPALGALRPHHALFLLVPLLVVGNGLTPYLEVKTGYGWNMYSNLRTVGGDSNHLILRRSFPLTEEQHDLVEIEDSSDPALRGYALRGYALTWGQLRSYLADHPDARITYRRGSALVALHHASDQPELVEPLPEWREKLLPFRAVDLGSPERCVPAFGPAR